MAQLFPIDELLRARCIKLYMESRALRCEAKIEAVKRRMERRRYRAHRDANPGRRLVRFASWFVL